VPREANSAAKKLSKRFRNRDCVLSIGNIAPMITANAALDLLFANHRDGFCLKLCTRRANISFDQLRRGSM
jgi:hypothetical protein